MPAFFAPRPLFAAAAAFCLIALSGCEKTDPIVTYTIPTKVPDQLLEGKDRMFAVMLPRGQEVWYFKVTGPELAMSNVESPFRKFVSEIPFNDNGPNLKELPDGWRRAGKKPMRFASINIDTPSKQLDMSISKLSRKEDWDQDVKMNVNRWRGQVGLEPSEERWAGAVDIELESADAPGVWVDLVGKVGDRPMSPPFAGAGAGAMPPGHPTVDPTQSPPPVSQQTKSESHAAPDDRLQFDRPDGWRDGRTDGMRMAAFNAGPEDAPAEITVIPAGGDLKGNVKRWMGQVREAEVTDEQVDQAMTAAVEVDVSGLKGHRYVLIGDEETIDATIVPLDGGMSLFIKMKGPARTVADQSEAVGQFIESLKLKL